MKWLESLHCAKCVGSELQSPEEKYANYRGLRVVNIKKVCTVRTPINFLPFLLKLHLLVSLY